MLSCNHRINILMSNIVFDYLANSMLFDRCSSDYKDETISELAKELEKYREYIKNNYTKIEKEILSRDGEKVIQDSQIFGASLENKKTLTKASLFVDSYVLNDPIHNLYYDDITLNRLVTMTKKPVNENKLKIDLAQRIKYMKGLVSGVQAGIEYIKFIPFYYNAVDFMPNRIRIPNIKSNLEESMFQWFLKKIQLYNVGEDGVLNKIPIYSNKISMNFENNDNMDSLIVKYMKLGETLEYVPRGEEYNNWVSQEKIKLINDTYSYLISKKNMYHKFNSNLRLKNIFEKEFYEKENIKISQLKNREFSVKMNFFGLYDISFEKSMSLRNRFRQEFKNFQEKLANDLKCLALISDERTMQEYVEELQKKYNEECERLKKRICNFDGVISRNIIPISSCIIIYLLDKNINNALIAAGGVMANEIIEQRKMKIKNPLFYLSQI